MSGAAPVFSASDFLGGFQKLLPTGPVWPREADAVQTQVFAALVQVYAGNAVSASGLLVEAFPATTNYLLTEWQETLGLPDPCAGEAPTLALEQAQVLARFTATGGQSMPYFTSVASALGYDITITQFAPFRAGLSRAGSPVCGEAWAFAWEVTAASGTTESNLVLQCELQRLSPAHTTVFFTFES